MFNRIIEWLLENRLVKWLDGKKTILGAIQLVLWVLIYGVPVVAPQYAYIAELGLWIQGLLQSAGLDIGGELLGAGTGLTIIGLLDKIRKMYRDYKQG